MSNSILLAQGDALRLPLPDNSVHCIVTSPPYWALRNYGVGVEAGELGLEPFADCLGWAGKFDPLDLYDAIESVIGELGNRPALAASAVISLIRAAQNKKAEPCGICHVCVMLACFEECRRVLHPSGTLWLNYGDMFATERPRGRFGDLGDLSTGDHGELGPRRNMASLPRGVKKGDRLLMWARIALACQAAGWWLRHVVIWYKPNPMPGPAGTWRRPIDSYEPIIMLAKNYRHYFYDAEAVREPPAGYTRKGGSAPYTANTPGITHGIGSNSLHQMAPHGRHMRDVWKIAPFPYPGAHFACFPPELPERCIKAATSERGVCPECGNPWKRQKAGGWLATCDHGHEPIPALVLDPFTGTGTTNLAARKLGRRSVGIDISHEYLVNEAKTRLGLDQLDQFYTGVTDRQQYDDLPLFGAEGA